MATDIFKKGSIEMLSLLIMQEEDVYGYRLAALIKKLSNEAITVQEGSLYPMLYQMLNAGYISARNEMVETKFGRSRSRVVYHLEPSGRERLIQLKKEYDAVHEGIQNVFENSKTLGNKNTERSE